MLRTSQVRSRRPITGLRLLALLGALVAGLFAGGGGVSAQPATLTLSMTESHDSLEPGARITFQVVVGNLDIAQQTTTLLFVHDLDTTFVQAESDPLWVAAPPNSVTASVPITGGGMRVVTLVLAMGPIGPNKHALDTFNFVEDLVGNRIQLVTPLNDVSLSSVADGGDPGGG